MKAVQLGQTGIETSRLGFGTAQLGPRMTNRQRRRLLDAAFDAGITHFDTAPIYGYGLAESTLGEFLQRNRAEVTVATKAGLGVPRLPLLRRIAGRPTVRRSYDPHDVRRSVAQSLRRLRTDYIDLLLLHECGPADVTDELLEALNGLTRSGLVRATGIATSATDARLIAAGDAFPAVIQIPHAELPALVVDSKRAIITHSAIAKGIGLARAVRENSRGIVLFSTRRIERIGAAARASESAA